MKSKVGGFSPQVGTEEMSLGSCLVDLVFWESSQGKGLSPEFGKEDQDGLRTKVVRKAIPGGVWRRHFR